MDESKRITVIVDDKTYQELLDYAHEQSKKAMRSVGIGNLIRQIVTNELKRMKDGHPPPLHN